MAHSKTVDPSGFSGAFFLRIKLVEANNHSTKTLANSNGQKLHFTLNQHKTM